MQIYVNKDGQQYGPYTIEQLHEYVQQGYFTAADHACHDGQNWVTVGQVPGFAGGAQAQPQQPQQDVQAQAAQSQEAQAAAHHQAQVAEAQAIAAAATAAAAKKKKIILWSSIGGVAACLIAGLLIWAPWSSDEEPSRELIAGAGKSGDNTASSTSTSKPATPGSSSKPSSSVALIDRIPSNALGAITIDVEKILKKGGEQAVAMVPSEVPPIVRKILKDPTAIGLDSSVPLQVHLLQHPTKPDEDPTFCIAGKLTDADKFKKTFEVLSGEDLEEKAGYALSSSPSGEACVAVTDEYFLFCVNEDRRASDHLVAEVERFVNADGSDSFLKANYGYEDFLSEGHDIGFWINGNALLEISPDEAPSDITSLFKGGAGAISVDFDDGEASIAGELRLAKDAPRFGKGGLSYEMTRMIPSKALAAFSLALDMTAVESYVEQVVLPAVRDQGEDVNLDEPIPELGIKPRDVIQTFKGEFSLAVTDFTLPVGVSDEQDEPFESTVEPQEDPGDDPFGGPSGGTPFPGTDAPTEDSPPDFPFPGEGPEDGLPEDGPGMGGGMPQVEFLFAAKVDSAKWEILKKAPPVGMVMGLAMLQGISISVEKGLLVVASKKHVDEGKAGTVNDNVSGSQLKMFQENDLVLKFDLAEIAKLQDTPVPPPAMKALEKFSYVAITGTSDETGGSGALRIGMTDKKTNSLAAFMELIPLLQAMEGDSSAAGTNSVDHDGNHDHDGTDGHRGGDDHDPRDDLEEEWEKKPSIETNPLGEKPVP